jgi:hypothetical protein
VSEKKRESDVENIYIDRLYGWAVSHIYVYRESETPSLLTGIDSFQVLVGEEKQIVWKEMGK